MAVLFSLDILLNDRKPW